MAQAQSVTERTAALNAEVQACATAHETAEIYLRSLRMVTPDDQAAYARAQLDMPAAAVARAEAVEDFRLARVELQAARTQARAAVRAELAPARRKLIDRLRHVLRSAAEAHAEVEQFDAHAAIALDGEQVLPVGWPGGPADLDDWYRRIG